MESKSMKDERAMMKEKLFIRLEKLAQYSKVHLMFSSAIINFATILMSFDRAPIDITKKILTCFEDMTNDALILLMLNPHTTVTLTAEPCYIPTPPSLPMPQKPPMQPMHPYQAADLQQQLTQLLTQQHGSPSLLKPAMQPIQMFAHKPCSQQVTQLPKVTQNQLNLTTQQQKFQKNSEFKMIVIDEPVKILEQYIFAPAAIEDKY